MRRRGKVGFNGWPSWRYGPNGEAEIFQREEDVPDGWGRKPGETGPVLVPKPRVYLDRIAIAQELEDLGVELEPQWGVAQMKKVLDDVRSAR